METPILLAAAGLCAFAVNLALLPLIIRVSNRRGWYDLPNGRKVHTSPVPRLGGVGIFASFLIAAVAVPAVVGALRGYPSLLPYEPRYAFLAGAFILMTGIGLADDFFSLSARLKFLLQIFAAILVTAGGFTLGPIRLPGGQVWSLGIFAYPLTVLWIVSLSNAMNLVDGVDGFAGGIAAFAALTLGVLAVMQGSALPALAAFSLLGSVAAFLIFNFPPARIFMGDSGAYLLGFTLSILPLLGQSSGSSLDILVAAVTLLTIPIIDTISAIVRRMRQKVSIGTPDKEHIHHRLREIGLKDRKLVLITYLYCFLLGAVSVAASLLRGLGSVLILAAAWACSIAAFFALRSAEVRGKAAAPDTTGGR
jgi:UDP-GlcNAc:undecaprenyl-phosphate/decaprenyl-phosphate GlcNAc-1-phosphate transferase